MRANGKVGGCTESRLDIASKNSSHTDVCYLLEDVWDWLVQQGEKQLRHLIMLSQLRDCCVDDIISQSLRDDTTPHIPASAWVMFR